MAYEQFETGEIILEENCKSNNKLYIMLTGEVSVVVKKKKTLT